MKSAADELAPLQGSEAYQALRAEILTGSLMPGERLSAASLNKRFELGLTPIREALMRLSSEGLVETENYRGARVRSVSAEEFRDVMARRREIEALCLNLSIKNGGTDWEGDILKAFHLLSNAPLPNSEEDQSAARHWEKVHRQFHFTLVKACASQWLLKFWNLLADHSERYRMLRLLEHHNALATPSARDLVAAHETIMKAAIDRDATKLLSSMDVHLENTERAVEKLINENTLFKAGGKNVGT